MNRSCSIAVILFFTNSFSLSASVPIQDNTVFEASEKIRRGDYLAARKLLAPILAKQQPESYEVAGGYFETFLATGEYEQGLETVKKFLEKFPNNPFLLNARGNLLVQTGNYMEAESLFKLARSYKQNFLENSSDLAGLYLKTGRKSQAKELYTEIFNRYKESGFPSVDLINLAALSAIQLEEFHTANRAFSAAYKIDPKNVKILYGWGSLLGDKFSLADAQRNFEEALEINPHWADLYSAYAQSVENFVAQEELAGKALEHNPNHVEAMNIIAELHILDSRYDEAEAIIRKSLQINPSSIYGLANLASIYHLRGQIADFNNVEKKALKINPACGEFYIVLAKNNDKRFRYKDAVEFSKKAVDIEPDNWLAHSFLGANLLRIGRTEDARYHLDLSLNNDSFNLFAKNSLDLLDGYENFEKIDSRHFSLKIHKSESVVLGPAILKIAEEAYDSLSIYYPYTPAGKILLEAYNDHADFAVRISGLPNLDLLGVCFGDIVAFDTPKAQMDDEYNWARTLWHELAHVFTVGLSDHRVPRWLTEGLSVYEEKRARSEWTRKMDLDLFAALDQDKLLPIAKINSGFTRPEFPRQIILSYYQSMKIVEFLINNYSFDVIPKLLIGFGNRKSDEQNFFDLFNKSIDEINEEFFKNLNEKRKKFNNVLIVDFNIFGEDKKDESTLKKLFGKKNSPYFEHCMAGIQLFEEKKYKEAEENFLKAIEIYRFYTASGNPYQGLARIYRTTKEKLKLVNILEKFLELSEYGTSESIELALYYSEINNPKKAEYYFTRSLYTNPYEISTYTNLAEIYSKQKMFGKEVEQRGILVSLNPGNKAESLYYLGFSLYNNQKYSEAKRQVLKALEIAPGYRDAQKLLLLCIEHKR